jgi:hypothetical protein
MAVESTIEADNRKYTKQYDSEASRNNLFAIRFLVMSFTNSLLVSTSSFSPQPLPIYTLFTPLSFSVITTHLQQAL